MDFKLLLDIFMHFCAYNFYAYFPGSNLVLLLFYSFFHLWRAEAKGGVEQEQAERGSQAQSRPSPEH